MHDFSSKINWGRRSKTAKFWDFTADYFDFPCEIFEILGGLNVSVVACNF